MTWIGLRGASIAASVFLVAVGTASVAVANETAVVVLKQPAEGPVPERALQTLERVLEREEAFRVVDARLLAQRIAGRLRRAPTLENGTSNAVEREAAELLEAVAFGRDQETIARGRAAIRRESVRLTAINRSEAASRALADVCLFVVRALMHRADESAASDQARECLRAIPDLTPSVETHPPDVRTLMAKVRSEQLGRLSAAALTPTQRACVLLIQGRRVGQLPMEIELVAGSYMLEADCGSPGFVHDVVVRAGHTQRVTFAPRLERALRLERPSVLQADEGTGALEPEDLARFAEWLSVSELWTLERRASALRITRWQRTNRGLVERNVAREALEPITTFDARLEAAIHGMLCTSAGCERSDRPARPPARVAGVVLAGTGISAMLGSWVAWNHFRELDADLGELDGSVFHPQYEETLDDRDRFGTVALVSSIGGSALFAAGAPLWLPEKDGVPWWAWSTGAAGALAIGAGAVLWIDHRRLEATQCTPGRVECSRVPATVPLVPMIVSQGSSLLSLPLTYLIRRWTRTGTGTLGIDARRGEYMLGWSESTSLW